jgi:hypothetical protein
MATMILVERKLQQNEKTKKFFITINSYFENEGFKIYDLEDAYLFFNSSNLSPVKFKLYLDTIKNTNNFDISTNNVYVNNNLQKI